MCSTQAPEILDLTGNGDVFNGRNLRDDPAKLDHGTAKYIIALSTDDIANPPLRTKALPCGRASVIHLVP